MKKKIIALILSTIMLTGILAGCAKKSADEPQKNVDAQDEVSTESSDDQEKVTETETEVDTSTDGKYKFAFSGSELANPWVAMVKDGFEAACKDNGIDFVSLNAGSDVDKQVADIENLLGGTFNGLVFNPIDGNALETVLNQATEKGIPSLTIAQKADAATGGIELDDAAYGAVIGQNAVEWINANLGGKGKVAVLSEDNIESSIKRGDAIVEAIEKGCPDVEIVARQHANTPELGLEAIESILLQHPDLNVVVCCNDSGGIGAYQAMQNANVSGDEYAIFSGDKTDEAMGYIKQEGSIYRGTADLHPYESGYDAVLMALEYLEKGLPAEHVSIPLGMEPITQADVLAGKYD